MSYSPFRHIGSVFWKRNPIHLTFFVTKRCNARCFFCFYRSNTGSADAEYELSTDEVRKISSSMGNLLWLAFSGGEIFLRSDIVELTKIFYERNRPSIILFPTNGLLTDVIPGRIQEILEHCRRSTIVVKLSLEGKEEVHYVIRGIRGSFKMTMQTYKALGRLLDQYPNFELGINTVFCSANQDNMDDVIEFVNGLDRIKTHTISLIRGTAGDKELKEVDVEKYLKAVDKLALNLKKGESSVYRFRGAKVKAAQDIVQRRLIYETEVKKRQLIPCYAGKLNLVLTESGDVYPCESFSMKLGNVRNNGYDMKKVLQTEQAQKVIKSINENKCFCTHECYLMTNILFNARMYPGLTKEYFQLCT